MMDISSRIAAYGGHSVIKYRYAVYCNLLCNFWKQQEDVGQSYEFCGPKYSGRYRLRGYIGNGNEYALE